MSTQRSSGWMVRAVLAAAAMAAGSLVVTGQITIPNTFTNHTIADAPQVNANFTALGSGALNRGGGTMTGTLSSRDVIPSTDTTYDLGSAALAFRDLYVKRNTILNGQTYSWPSGHGVSGTVLTENGSGTLTWGAITSSVGRCDLRLTLTSGAPVTIADVTAATSVFVSPTPGAQCSFYDGSTAWALLSNIAEVTIAVPATTATMYDVFCFNNSGTMACDAALAWTNDTTRATALTTQNAVYVKTAATTRRYIGSFRTTAVSGQTEDSFAKRYVWSFYNRRPRLLRVTDTTDTWPYTTATWRQANGAAANQVDVVIGVAEVALDVRVLAVGNNSSAGVTFYTGIGEDVTNALATGVVNDTGPSITGGIQVRVMKQAWLQKYPAVGRHFYAWLEYSEATGTTTWYGDNGGVLSQSGMVGVIEGD